MSWMYGSLLLSASQNSHAPSVACLTRLVLSKRNPVQLGKPFHGFRILKKVLRHKCLVLSEKRQFFLSPCFRFSKIRTATPPLVAPPTKLPSLSPRPSRAVSLSSSPEPSAASSASMLPSSPNSRTARFPIRRFSSNSPPLTSRLPICPRTVPFLRTELTWSEGEY